MKYQAQDKIHGMSGPIYWEKRNLSIIWLSTKFIASMLKVSKKGKCPKILYTVVSDKIASANSADPEGAV